MSRINTYFGDGNLEPIECYGGRVRDTIILLRDACHKMSLCGLREVHVIQSEKDYRIEVKVRK